MMKILVFMLAIGSFAASSSVENNNELDAKPPIRLDPALRRALLRAITNLENDSPDDEEDTTNYQDYSTTEPSELLETSDESSIKTETPVTDQESSVQYHSFVVDGQKAFEKNLTANSLPVEAKNTNEGNEFDTKFKSPDPLNDADIIVKDSDNFNALTQTRSIQKDIAAENSVAPSTKQPPKSSKTTISKSSVPATKPTTTTPRPIFNEDGENIEQLEDHEVQVFQAPLVAAFTVHQDAQGLPRSVIPIYKQAIRQPINPLPPVSRIQLQPRPQVKNQQDQFQGNAQQQSQVQQQQFAIQQQLEQKQRILENQLRELQLQQKQHEELLKQQQILQQQQIIISQNERQRQQQLLFEEEQRKRQLQFLQQQQQIQQQNQQNTVRSNNFNQQPQQQLNQQNQQQNQKQNTIRTNNFNQQSQQLNQNQRQESQIQIQQLQLQQLPQTTQQQNFQQNLLTAPSFTFQPSIALQPSSGIINEQQPPQREAVDFLVHLRSRQPSQFPLQAPVAVPSAQQQLPRESTFQSSFNDARPSGTRVFRHDSSSTGNFGVNNNQFDNNNFFNNRNQNVRPQQNRYRASNDLKNLLFQSGLTQGGRSQEDLSIVSKVLSLNHGIPRGNFLNEDLDFIFGESKRLESK